MDPIASHSETCTIPRTQQSSQQFTEHIIKQEVSEDQCVRNSECFGETGEDYCDNIDVLLTKVECNLAEGDSASLNCGLQTSFNEDEEKGEVFTELLTSMTKPVKNEEDQHGSAPWSVFAEPGSITLLNEVKQENECDAEVEDDVVYDFEPGFGEEEEAYDEITDAELDEDSATSTEDLEFDENPKAKLYKCTDCNYTSKGRGFLSRHIAREHDREDPEYQCVKRSYKIKRKQDPAIKSLHDKQTGFYKCPHCDFTTKHKRSITQHLEMRHNPDAKVYKCPDPDCNYTSKCSRYLIRHVTRTHSTDVPIYRCKECSYTTKWKPDLNIHIKFLHNSQAVFRKCPHCDFATKYNTSLRQHLKLKHNIDVKLFKCTECNYTSKCKRYLTRHVTRRHTPNVPARCEKCRYSNKADTNPCVHIKTAQDESAEVHQCPHCKYSTKKKYSLARHVREQHDPDVKLYKCTECNFATKQRYNLNNHMAANHNPDAPLHQCSECDFTTKWRSNLTTHVTAKHSPNGQLHQCTECSYTSKLKYKLSRHVKKKHSKPA